VKPVAIAKHIGANIPVIDDIDGIQVGGGCTVHY